MEGIQNTFIVIIIRKGVIKINKNMNLNMETINLKTESLADKVYNIIENKIINLKIPPGSNLSEVNIANSFNISRSPVREALYRLEYKGLVKRSSNGRIVAEINKKELVDNYQAWKMVESFTAALASKNANNQDIQELTKIKNLLENFTEEEMINEYREYNYKFHTKLVAPCKNDYLVNIHKNILNKVEWCYNYSILLISDMKLSSILHDKIYDAYVNKNITDLKRYINKHIDSASKRFQKAWDEKENN